ncbi:aldehyde dehydrogenase family protein [Actinomadura sp. 7K507]|uniref:aldehyde dehydrogenase family protein n=1 Tax=Actinomadura sp. 7K507 TaxID=2530365 RepID=UPI00104C0DD8|nr:aldehyde dehydrogenase family protein [Actinomadura sp. 7K507]TDC97604.1 aldehyde dehydrogenase family protein [Actinomadura sp. 7K507]
METFTSHYIDGRWQAAGTGRIAVGDPATGEVTGEVPAGTAADAAAAVAAAARAFPAWSATPAADRGALLERLTGLLAARKDRLAAAIVAEVGSPASFAAAVQVGLPLATLASQPKLLGEVGWRREVGHSAVVREPAGVVVAITPWNYPLHQIAAKVAPALAVGCTVVLKPSEVAPLNAFLLAEAVHEAGFPPGVFNLVCGTGADAGEHLVSHRDVDVVSFTGSTAAGRRIGALAAATVKQVHLELGGKSPNVILDDADLEAAVADGLVKAFVNSGQTCTALSRMIVPRARLAEAEQIAASAVANHPLVDPATETSGVRPSVLADKLGHVGFTFALGPVVSAAQRDRVTGYIRSGVEEGARLVAGGPERPDGFDRGHYVRPTVFSGTSPGMAIVQEEIFGPVLCLQAYDGEDEAVALANGTRYGLCAAVWSADADRAAAVAGRLRAGQVDINGARFNPFAPFGGYKQSGHGRELGLWGLEAFLQTKSLQLP